MPSRFSGHPHSDGPGRERTKTSMVHAKVLKLQLDDYGSYLGRGEGCFEVRYRDGSKTRYPHFEKEIGEAVLKSGSYVSVSALIDLALWNIDTYIMTRRNRVVAVLK